VERLARRAAALPHERRMALVWTNHAGLSEERSEKLRELFAAQLEAVQIRVVQGEAAPALRVSIEQTPTKLVLTTSVPGEGSMSVAIEEVARRWWTATNGPRIRCGWRRSWSGSRRRGF